MSRTIVTPDEARRSQPWLELDPTRDTTGLIGGEKALFADTEERAEFFAQQLYGKRFSTAAFLLPEVEFHQMMFIKANLRPGERVLFIGEAIEPIGYVKIAQDMIGPDLEVVAVEMRPLARKHGGGKWGLYREITEDYADGVFDAVVASQIHHCDELVPEFEAVARVVKPGGKLVLVDHGPGEGTFELAKQDVLLNWLLNRFVTWAGSRHVPNDQAFDYQKANWLSRTPNEIFEAARLVIDDVRLWEHRAMFTVDGVVNR